MPKTSLPIRHLTPRQHMRKHVVGVLLAVAFGLALAPGLLLFGASTFVALAVALPLAGALGVIRHRKPQWFDETGINLDSPKAAAGKGMAHMPAFLSAGQMSFKTEE